MNDNPGILSKLNIWTYVNVRFFKFKFTRNIFFFIQGLSQLKQKSILYNYRDWNFENFFYKFNKFFLFLFLLLIFV